MLKNATSTAKPATRRRTYRLLHLALLLLGLALALPSGAFASVGGGLWQSPLAQGSPPITAPSSVAAAASPLPCLRWEPNLLTLLAVQQAELTNPDAARGDSWGCSVAISGETGLVGAAGTAAACVFTRSGTSWSLQAKLTNPDPTYNDEFGYSVALSGDTALVSGKSGSGSGAVYVFTRTGTSWSQQAELTNPKGGDGFSFGCSVALSGDTALVGDANNAGDAYVFTRTGTSWSKQAELTVSDARDDASIPSAVALSGDTALVSGIRYGPAAYVFTRSGTSWSQQAKLTGGWAEDDTNWGCSVALSGDTALVGYERGEGGRRVAYVEVLTPTPTVTLKLSGLTSGAMRLGRSVTATGKVTPTSLAGSKVKLTVQKRGAKWVTLKSVARTISASGAYSWKYKPARRGAYRMRATIAKSAAHAAATTKWRTFKVK